MFRKNTLKFFTLLILVFQLSCSNSGKIEDQTYELDNYSLIISPKLNFEIIEKRQAPKDGLWLKSKDSEILISNKRIYINGKSYGKVNNGDKLYWDGKSLKISDKEIKASDVDESELNREKNLFPKYFLDYNYYSTEEALSHLIKIEDEISQKRYSFFPYKVFYVAADQKPIIKVWHKMASNLKDPTGIFSYQYGLSFDFFKIQNNQIKTTFKFNRKLYEKVNNELVQLDEKSVTSLSLDHYLLNGKKYNLSRTVYEIGNKTHEKASPEMVELFFKALSTSEQEKYDDLLFKISKDDKLTKTVYGRLKEMNKTPAIERILRYYEPGKSYFKGTWSAGSKLIYKSENCAITKSYRGEVWVYYSNGNTLQFKLPETYSRSFEIGEALEPESFYIFFRKSSSITKSLTGLYKYDKGKLTLIDNSPLLQGSEKYKGVDKNGIHYFLGYPKGSNLPASLALNPANNAPQFKELITLNISKGSKIVNNQLYTTLNPKKNEGILTSTAPIMKYFWQNEPYEKRYQSYLGILNEKMDFQPLLSIPYGTDNILPIKNAILVNISKSYILLADTKAWHFKNIDELIENMKDIKEFLPTFKDWSQDLFILNDVLFIKNHSGNNSFNAYFTNSATANEYPKDRNFKNGLRLEFKFLPKNKNENSCGFISALNKTYELLIDGNKLKFQEIPRIKISHWVPEMGDYILSNGNSYEYTPQKGFTFVDNLCKTKLIYPPSIKSNQYLGYHCMNEIFIYSKQGKYTFPYIPVSPSIESHKQNVFLMSNDGLKEIDTIVHPPKLNNWGLFAWQELPTLHLGKVHDYHVFTAHQSLYLIKRSAR